MAGMKEKKKRKNVTVTMHIHTYIHAYIYRYIPRSYISSLSIYIGGWMDGWMPFATFRPGLIATRIEPPPPCPTPNPLCRYIHHTSYVIYSLVWFPCVHNYRDALALPQTPPPNGSMYMCGGADWVLWRQGVSVATAGGVERNGDASHGCKRNHECERTRWNQPRCAHANLVHRVDKCR